MTVDSAGGLIVFGIFGFLFIQSLFLQSAINASPFGLFLGFGVITIIGFFYVLFFLRDTSGLSDKQKKSLYTSIRL